MKRWLVIAACSFTAVVAAGLLARELLDVRALLGFTDDPACTPDAIHVRYPNNSASAAGTWSEAESYPRSRDEVRAVALGGQIYVGTGLTVRDGAFTSLSEFFRFDPSRGTYESLADVPQRLDHAALVAHDHAIYVIGGYVDTRPLAEVWRYSVKTEAWTALAPMRIARGSPAAAVIGDKIYVAGGSKDDQGAVTGALSSVEVYDIATGAWSSAPDMPTPRHHHGAASLGGRLFVVGGRNDDDLSLDVVEQFDPANGRWTRLPSLPAGAGGVAVVAAGDRIVAVGGGDDDELWLTPAAWAYDPASATWTRIADLRVARHGHAAAAVGSDVYVFAGSPCPGYGHTDAVEHIVVESTSSAG
jgi:N-acetylneuraminic acid mutarotase